MIPMYISRSAFFAVLFGLMSAASVVQAQNMPPAVTPDAAPVITNQKTLGDLLPGALLSPEQKSTYTPDKDAPDWLFPSGKYRSETYDEETLYALYYAGEYNKILYNMLQLARQGNPRAEETLGLMYRMGQGIKQDNLQAVRWFTRAAEKQRPLAQHHLGVLYFEGPSGIARDMMRAATWLELAVTNYPPGAERDRAISDLENVKLRLSRLEQMQAADSVKKYLQRYPINQTQNPSAAADEPAINGQSTE